MKFSKGLSENTKAILTSLNKLADRVLDKPEYTHHVTEHNYKHPIVPSNRDDTYGHGFGGDAFGKGYYTTQNKDVMSGYKDNLLKPIVRRQRLPRLTKIFDYNNPSVEALKALVSLINKRVYKNSIPQESIQRILAEYTSPDVNGNPSDMLKLISLIGNETYNIYNNAIKQLEEVKYKKLFDNVKSLEEAQHLEVWPLKRQIFNKDLSSDERAALKSRILPQIQAIQEKYSVLLSEAKEQLNPYHAEAQELSYLAERPDNGMLTPLIKELGYDAIEYRPNTIWSHDDIDPSKGNNILVLNQDILTNPRQFQIDRANRGKL